MNKLTIKSPEELAIMREGGQKLGVIRNQLIDSVAPGVSAADIEKIAMALIHKHGGAASFAMVPGYKWATCINVNDGVVHGIPSSSVIFQEGDVVSIDVGMLYKGFHTDTASSTIVGKKPSAELKNFLAVGKKTLDLAIAEAKVGKRIGDISRIIEKNLRAVNYSPMVSLTGHGVGRALHEDPRVPCVVQGTHDESVIIREGMALAIEIMYSQGNGQLKTQKDGWTIKTKDGTISALFEQTVGITNNGPIVLTHA